MSAELEGAEVSRALRRYVPFMKREAEHRKAYPEFFKEAGNRFENFERADYNQALSIVRTIAKERAMQRAPNYVYHCLREAFGVGWHPKRRR